MIEALTLTAAFTRHRPCSCMVHQMGRTPQPRILL